MALLNSLVRLTSSPGRARFGLGSNQHHDMIRTIGEDESEQKVVDDIAEYGCMVGIASMSWPRLAHDIECSLVLPSVT